MSFLSPRASVFTQVLQHSKHKCLVEMRQLINEWLAEWSFCCVRNHWFCWLWVLDTDLWDVSSCFKWLNECLCQILLQLWQAITQNDALHNYVLASILINSDWQLQFQDCCGYSECLWFPRHFWNTFLILWNTPLVYLGRNCSWDIPPEPQPPLWEWGQPFSCLCPSYQSWCGFCKFLVIRLLFSKSAVGYRGGWFYCIDQKVYFFLYDCSSSAQLSLTSFEIIPLDFILTALISACI